MAFREPFQQVNGDQIIIAQNDGSQKKDTLRDEIWVHFIYNYITDTLLICTTPERTTCVVIRRNLLCV